MSTQRCRHNKSWLICGARWEWCYECGAIREMRTLETTNGCYPVTQWCKPVGKGGDNPYPPKPKAAKSYADQPQDEYL